MPITILIDDASVVGFDAEAIAGLEEEIREHAKLVITEAYGIERRETAPHGQPDVKKGMVRAAAAVLRYGGIPKPKTWIRILRIISAILALAVGILYDPTALQAGGYMLLFVGTIAATVISVTISTLKE